MYASLIAAVLNFLGRLLPFILAYHQGKSSVKKTIAEKQVEIANKAEIIDARPKRSHADNVRGL